MWQGRSIDVRVAAGPQAQDGEKITLNGVLEITNLSKLSGINQPLTDEYVLTQNELENIENYRESFNQIIKQVSTASGLVVINADDLLIPFVNGKTMDGVLVSTQFIEGGLFSLDGIHLTSRGYAIVANAIITTINNNYSSEIPTVDISKYNGVNIP